MAYPSYSPPSRTNVSILTSTGSTITTGNGAGNVALYPFGIYVDPVSPRYDANFISGASDQVSFVYKKLGGDVLDLEITPGNVYAAYEEATLEYSYIMNLHQSKNALPSLLGKTTGSFDEDGNLLESSLSNANINLRYPRFEVGYARQVAIGLANEAGVAGGTTPHYNASFALTTSVQDYDLQQIIANNVINNREPATGNPVTYSASYASASSSRITIRRVYYKSPAAVWRFYGYYGGLNVVGNLNYYGQFADDTTFEIIPAWQNKLQAMAYEDHIYTRLSHYSYEIFNNKLRVFPTPETGIINYMWFEFSFDDGTDPWMPVSGSQKGSEQGISNMNTLPFDNIPYSSINAIGKQWIRRYALALVKETLGLIRSKFGAIPIPGDSVQLNGSELISSAREEQEKLKEELKTTLDELTYTKLAETNATLMDSVTKVQEKIPLLIYQG
jgi:hypothetical protein